MTKEKFGAPVKAIGWGYCSICGKDIRPGQWMSQSATRGVHSEHTPRVKFIRTMIVFIAAMLLLCTGLVLFA